MANDHYLFTWINYELPQWQTSPILVGKKNDVKRFKAKNSNQSPNYSWKYQRSSTSITGCLLLFLISMTFLWEFECRDGTNVGLAAGRYSGNRRPDRYRTPHALHRVFGPIGPSLHCGVSVTSQCVHFLFMDSTATGICDDFFLFASLFFREVGLRLEAEDMEGIRIHELLVLDLRCLDLVRLGMTMLDLRIKPFSTEYKPLLSSTELGLCVWKAPGWFWLRLLVLEVSSIYVNGFCSGVPLISKGWWGKWKNASKQIKHNWWHHDFHTRHITYYKV